MSARTVHLRPESVVNLGHTKTLCGKTIYSAPQDMTGAVLTFGTALQNIDVTVHGTLATCERCLRRVRP